MNDYDEHRAHHADVDDAPMTYGRRETMFCHECRIPVMGGVAMHELTRHGGAQTCWMTNDNECRRLGRERHS